MTTQLTETEFEKPTKLTTMVRYTIALILGIPLLIVGGVHYMYCHYMVHPGSPDTTLDYLTILDDKMFQLARILTIIAMAAMWLSWLHDWYNYKKYSEKN